MGSPRLCTGPPPDGKRDSERKSRRAEHAEAFGLATLRITRHLVAEIGKPGQRLLEEIADGKKRGPAEVLEQIVDVARDHKDEGDALAPVRLLARRLGYDLAPLPVGSAQGVDVVGACASAMAEVGEAVTAALEAASDRTVTAAEARRCLPEIDEAIAQLHRVRGQMVASAERVAGGVR